MAHWVYDIGTNAMAHWNFEEGAIGPFSKNLSLSLLWQCKKYRKEREILFKKVSLYDNKFPNFHNDTMKSKLLFKVNRCKLTNYAQTLYQIC
jgi:hypothetical protein